MPPDTPLTLTLIVPTYNEGENVRVLARTVLGVMREAGEGDFEILFVDDSTDSTPGILEELSREEARIRFIHRKNERGLGTAIVRGFREARGEVLAVMDGDLQHPPSLLPSMRSRISAGYDLVLPSRFLPGGSDGGLTLPRKMVSLTARSLARILLGRVRSVSDPTGGFFMLKKSVIAGTSFDAESWKILIEILVKGNYGRVAELPYAFHARELGTSKLTAKEQINYLRHLKTLFTYASGPGRTSAKAIIDRLPS